jgi:NAD(P)-dependent dehydrogenase (short-subunit alcohol dehydrogenase family)
MEKKVMIVSGGASGLGLAAAIKFAKNDFNVVIIDIDKEKGEEAAKKIRSIGVDAVFCLCDISNKGQVQNAAEVTKARFGRADVLINNAGYSEWRPIEAIDQEFKSKVKKTKTEAEKTELKQAREKAKEAKKEAILAFLEAKNIKKTYMLDDIDESDSDNEDFGFNEIEDL